MKLKKIVSLALAGILAVSMLTACGDGATDPTPNEPTEPTVTNYAQLLKDKLEYNPGKKVNAVSNTKLDGAMDVAMEFAADGTISGAYFTAALDHTLYVTNKIVTGEGKVGQSFVNAANYLIRELSAENNVNQTIVDACGEMQPTDDNYNKDNLNATLLFVVDGGKGINAVMEEVADLLDRAINGLDDDFDTDTAGTKGEKHVQADYEYDMSVSVQTKTLTADHSKSLTLVAVNIARV